MSKLIISKHPRAIPCPLCGLNTVLLPDNQKVHDEDKVYCRQCKNDGISKMQIDPGDFYAFLFKQKNIQNDCMNGVKNESICNRLKKTEIAHLHGEYARENDMYLDFIYDEAADKPYFRISIIEDDDPWFGSESYQYLEAEEVHGLLSKNGIYLFEGMTELNWKSYIWFTNN